MNRVASALTDPWAGFTFGDGLGVPVAIGGDLTPGTLLGAYRRAVFCQPRSDEDEVARNEATYSPDVRAGDIPILPGNGNPYATLWWSPAVRYVIGVDQVHMNRSLRRTIRVRDWVTTFDAEFDRVIAGCRADREPCWITDGLVTALRALKDAGWVHTAEVWDGETLIGGLFGYAIGRVFIAESAFHRQPDAAKVAIADLASRAMACGMALVDTEVKSAYTVHLGARPMPRDDYLTHLAARTEPAPIGTAHMNARYLLG